MIYRVWIPDDGETIDHAREYEAPSPERAARLAAENDHAHRDGWEWTWPVTYYVQAAGEPVVSVEVDREMSPVFLAATPRAV